MSKITVLCEIGLGGIHHRTEWYMKKQTASLETKERLQQCALQEFMEKGYLKASLRNICKQAGVTTGALYFFFEDKDALFVSLVSGLLQEIQVIMKEHFLQEQNGNTISGKEDLLAEMSGEGMAEDEETSLQVIHVLYAEREAALLLLTKSQGSSVEPAVDALVQVATEHYRQLADRTTKALGMEPLQDAFVHWISHMQIDTFIYMVTHIEREEEAKIYIRQATQYMVNGWYGLFLREDK